jgi:hypothetical protein
MTPGYGRGRVIDAMFPSTHSKRLVTVMDAHPPTLSFLAGAPGARRLELANAIVEFLEIWHNRKRRRSQLGWLNPDRVRTQRDHHRWHENPRNPDPRNPGQTTSTRPGEI